jgi:hypothetical protein
MKTMKWMGWNLLAILMMVGMVACTAETEIPEEPQAEKYVEVGLKCAGEFLKVSEEEAMSRAGGDSIKSDYLYGIQVYTVSETDGYPIYTKYAYGVFCSLDNVVIRLLQGQKYKFQVAVGVDGKSGMYWFDGKYVWNADTEFTYSQTDGLNSYNFSNIYDENKIKFETFYGELDMYEPAQDGLVEIATKRTAYGVKYITKNLTEGTLKVEVVANYTDYDLTLTPEHTAAAPYTGIFSFSDIQGAWRGSWNSKTQLYENYYCAKALTISWTKADGSVVPLGTHAITFKRNIRTTITIDVKDTSLNNGIRITMDDAPMADDEKEYEISGGTVIETPVTGN